MPFTIESPDNTVVANVETLFDAVNAVSAFVRDERNTTTEFTISVTNASDAPAELVIHYRLHTPADVDPLTGEPTPEIWEYWVADHIGWSKANF